MYKLTKTRKVCIDRVFIVTESIIIKFYGMLQHSHHPYYYGCLLQLQHQHRTVILCIFSFRNLSKALYPTSVNRHSRSFKKPHWKLCHITTLMLFKNGRQKTTCAIIPQHKGHSTFQNISANQISDNCFTLSPNLWQLTTSVWVFAQTKLSVVSSAVGMSINHCLS